MAEVVKPEVLQLHLVARSAEGLVDVGPLIREHEALAEA